MKRIKVDAAALRALAEMQFLLARKQRQENAEPHKPTGWAKATDTVDADLREKILEDLKKRING